LYLFRRMPGIIEGFFLEELRHFGGIVGLLSKAAIASRALRRGENSGKRQAR